MFSLERLSIQEVEQFLSFYTISLGHRIPRNVM